LRKITIAKQPPHGGQDRLAENEQHGKQDHESKGCPDPTPAQNGSKWHGLYGILLASGYPASPQLGLRLQLVSKIDLDQPGSQLKQILRTGWNSLSRRRNSRLLTQHPVDFGIERQNGRIFTHRAPALRPHSGSV
jgi:hypothetical protein